MAPRPFAHEQSRWRRGPSRRRCLRARNGVVCCSNADSLVSAAPCYLSLRIQRLLFTVTTRPPVVAPVYRVTIAQNSRPGSQRRGDDTHSSSHYRQARRNLLLEAVEAKPRTNSAQPSASNTPSQRRRGCHGLQDSRTRAASDKRRSRRMLHSMAIATPFAFILPRNVRRPSSSEPAAEALLQRRLLLPRYTLDPVDPCPHTLQSFD